MIIDADASQLEWRVAAFLSQDQVMMDEIRNGVDAHKMAVTDIMELPFSDENRQTAKVTNFRMIYGGSPYAFHMDTKMPDFGLKKWERIVENFYKKYFGLAAWQKENYRRVTRTGQLVNPTGRILTFDKKRKNDGSEVYSWPEVCNYPVQSLATADIIPLAMVVAKRRLAKISPDIKMVMQVHDSLVLDVPKKYVDISCETMYNILITLPELIKQFFGIEFNVPMSGECKYGETWGKMTKWEAK